MWVGFVNAWSAFPHLSLVHINVVHVYIHVVRDIVEFL